MSCVRAGDRLKRGSLEVEPVEMSCVQCAGGDHLKYSLLKCHVRRWGSLEEEIT